MNANIASGSTPFDKGQRIKLSKVVALIAAIRKIDPRMPLGEVMFFITTAQNEGKSLKELAERCEILMPAASNYLDDLMFISGKNKGVGVSLLTAYDNPIDRRQKIITLTPAGRKLVENLIEGI